MWVLLALLFLKGYVCRSITLASGDVESGECEALTQTFITESTKYIIFNQRVTWEEANVICPSYKGRLAVLSKVSHTNFLAHSLSEADKLYKLDAMWVGGRKYPNGNWSWSNGYPINILRGPNYDVRTKFRDDKECLALVRQAHRGGSFVDLDCSLPKAFICQTGSKGGAITPLPTNWVRYKGVMYIIYSARVTWKKAVSFCRSHGMQLAKFSNSNVGYVVKGVMTQSRPSSEMAWISGYKVNGHWTWLTDGSSIPPVRNTTIDYPPWRDDDESLKEGCLLFDKHDCMPGMFLGLDCERKRSFICEKYDMSTDETYNPKLTFPCGSQLCILVDIRVSWSQAERYCVTHYESHLLKLENIEQAILASEAMSDHPREVKHVWIGGHQERGDVWKWTMDGSVIPATTKQPKNGKDDKEYYFFPPWCNVDILGMHKNQELCLNLDRTDYRQSVIYGMACNTTQAFICVVGTTTTHNQTTESHRKTAPQTRFNGTSGERSPGDTDGASNIGNEDDDAYRLMG